MEQNQNLTAHKDDNVSRIIDLTNQIEVQTGPSKVHPSGPAPPVLVCCDAGDHRKHLTYFLKFQSQITDQDRMVFPTKGIETVVDDRYSPRLMQRESHKEQIW